LGTTVSYKFHLWGLDRFQRELIKRRRVKLTAQDKEDEEAAIAAAARGGVYKSAFRGEICRHCITLQLWYSYRMGHKPQECRLKIHFLQERGAQRALNNIENVKKPIF
jgi:hypothetical protein